MENIIMPDSQVFSSLTTDWDLTSEVAACLKYSALITGTHEEPYVVPCSTLACWEGQQLLGEFVKLIPSPRSQGE